MKARSPELNEDSFILAVIKRAKPISVSLGSTFAEAIDNILEYLHRLGEEKTHR